MTEEQIAVARAIYDAGLYDESFDEVIEEVAAMYGRDNSAAPMRWLRDAFYYWDSLGRGE